MKSRRIASLKTAGAFHDYLAELGTELPFDEEVESGSAAPLAQSYSLKNGFILGNRFAALPMEGWDGTRDGRPTELTTRRWQNFGKSGAKLIWGGEAVAVRHDGRANPNQLLISAATSGDIAGLREALVEAHETAFGDSSPRNGMGCMGNGGGYHPPMHQRNTNSCTSTPTCKDSDSTHFLPRNRPQRVSEIGMGIQICVGFRFFPFLFSIEVIYLSAPLDLLKLCSRSVH